MALLRSAGILLGKELRTELRSFASMHPRWGQRRALVHVRSCGYQVGRKKIQRLWREEGLRVAQRARRKRPGVSTTAAMPAAHRTRSGRSTSSSTPQPTVARSRSLTSSRVHPGKHSAARSPAPSPARTSPTNSTESPPPAAADRPHCAATTTRTRLRRAR